MPPAEMQGATMHVFHNGPTVKSIVSYIGSTVFQMSANVTRRYDLDSQSKVGPYIRAISKKLKEGGVDEAVFSYASHAYASLVTLAEAVARGRFNMPVAAGYPAIWANSPWAQTNTLDPGAPMANQMKTDADDLLSMLGNPSRGQSKPATDPPDPTPRVEEGDPTNNSTPPHRRSVIKGLRDPKTYLASLSR